MAMVASSAMVLHHEELWRQRVEENHMKVQVLGLVDFIEELETREDQAAPVKSWSKSWKEKHDDRRKWLGNLCIFGNLAFPSILTKHIGSCRA